jgi:molybdopterin molybdotransferase
VGDLLSVSDALQMMLSEFLPVSTKVIPIEQSIGRVLVNDLVASIDLPPFDNSSMDGFGLKAIGTFNATK